MDSQLLLGCPKGHPVATGLLSAENHPGSERLLHGQAAMPVITHSAGSAEGIAKTGYVAYGCPPLENCDGEAMVVQLACGACCCPRRLRNRGRMHHEGRGVAALPGYLSPGC